MMKAKILLGALATGAILAALPTPASAVTNLVQNGSFEDNITGQIGFSPGLTTLKDWTVTAGPGVTYPSAFIFSNSTAYTTGVGPTSFVGVTMRRFGRAGGLQT